LRQQLMTNQTRTSSSASSIKFQRRRNEKSLDN
jgi:hypothetical protein